MKYTENYNLNLPEGSDYAQIESLNENTAQIDAELKAREDALAAHDLSQLSHAGIRQLIQDLDDALGDVYTKPETDARIAEDIAAHNTDEAAHPYILHQLVDRTARIKMLEDFLYNDITGNPHSITFVTLDGLVVTGVWNETQARLEC